MRQVWGVGEGAVSGPKRKVLWRQVAHLVPFPKWNHVTLASGYNQERMKSF